MYHTYEAFAIYCLAVQSLDPWNGIDDNFDFDQYANTIDLKFSILLFHVQIVLVV